MLTWDFMSFSRFEISLQSKSILSCMVRIVFDIASFFNLTSSMINSWILDFRRALGSQIDTLRSACDWSDLTNWFDWLKQPPYKHQFEDLARNFIGTIKCIRNHSLVESCSIFSTAKVRSISKSLSSNRFASFLI